MFGTLVDDPGGVAATARFASGDYPPVDSGSPGTRHPTRSTRCVPDDNFVPLAGSLTNR